MNAPLVSIIIPTFNMGDLIGDTIRSCLDQTYQHIEIIVVDDGSTDDTQTKVSAFARHGVKYILQRNHGAPAAARNHGTRLANGKYLQFLDADDLIHIDKLSKQVDQLESAASPLTVSYCDYLFFRASGSETLYRRLGPAHMEDWKVCLNDQLCQYTVVHRFLFPKQTLSSFGGFDESMGQCEDLDLWIRLLVEGVSFEYIDCPMAYYRETIGMSVSNPKGQILGHIHIISKLSEQMSKLGILALYSEQLSFALTYWSSKLTQFHPANE